MFHRSALAALSRIEEVDIKGGWKTGDPCVLYMLTGHISNLVLTEYHMQRWQKLLLL
jgi:hypothetical protein